MATGGCHLTHDDMLILIEMASRLKDAGEIEKEKKRRLGLQAAEESARAILALGKLVTDLKGADLDVLLKWHQVKMEKGAKVPDKRRVCGRRSLRREGRRGQRRGREEADGYHEVRFVTRGHTVRARGRNQEEGAGGVGGFHEPGGEGEDDPKAPRFERG
jgi:hypothetical protein